SSTVPKGNHSLSGRAGRGKGGQEGAVSAFEVRRSKTAFAHSRIKKATHVSEPGASASGGMRNSKSETNTKFKQENPKRNSSRLEFFLLGDSGLFWISDFDIRIWVSSGR